jgi:hypothetical protein
VQVAILVSVVGLLITVISSALALARRLGGIETKVDMMFDWFQSHIDIRVGGRRRTDVAADDGTEQ